MEVFLLLTWECDKHILEEGDIRTMGAYCYLSEPEIDRAVRGLREWKEQN